jgi:hypothetical protein
MIHTRLSRSLTLGELIGFLKSLPPSLKVWDLTNDHSYRGYYRDLAFEVADYQNDVESLIEWLEPSTARSTGLQRWQLHDGSAHSGLDR